VGGVMGQQAEAASPYELVLSRLEGVKRWPKGGAMARCPVHNDRTASLKIDEKADGSVLIFDHGGCKTTQIVEAIGLTMSDLSDGKPKALKPVKLVAAYNYRDVTGQVLYQVCRWSPKRFSQRRPDGHGGWINDLKGVSPILYRLPELIAAPPHEWVLIPEGEKDVDNLVALGFVATTNSGGAGKFKPEFAEHFKDRRVAIWPDNDEPGLAHARMVAAILAPVAREVRIVEPSGGAPAKGDVSDLIGAGYDRELIQKMIERAPKYEEHQAKPIIQEDSDQHPIVATQAFSALQRCNRAPVRIVRFTGSLSRIERDEVGEHRIVDLDVHRLRDELTAAADWIDKKFRPAVPSVDFGRLLLAKPEPPLPAVTRFVRSPVFTKDGRLLRDCGFDASSGIYVLPHPFKLHDIPEQPSIDEVGDARELLLKDLLGDFPFASDSDRANALALPIERVAREMIEGPLPINVIEASVRGAGKGLLSRALLGITNTPAAVWSEVRDDAEMRKALTSFFAVGTEALLIDNLRRALSSPVLAAAVTTEDWVDRLLSTNRLLRAKVRCSWIVTANNLMASSEMLRRSSRIRLVPKEEHPENRNEFTHPNLMQWVVENRSRLLRAVIILVNNWLAHTDERGKRPQPLSVKPLGSFESWSTVIGGILETSGIPEFQANRREFADAADAEAAPWRELIGRWWDIHKTGVVQSKDLFPIAEQIEAFPLRGTTERGQRLAFGNELMKWRDRVLTITVEKKQIEVRVTLAPEKRQHSAQWQLEVTGNAAA
jgi:hypothetical protein